MAKMCCCCCCRSRAWWDFIHTKNGPIYTEPAANSWTHARPGGHRGKGSCAVTFLPNKINEIKPSANNTPSESPGVLRTSPRTGCWVTVLVVDPHFGRRYVFISPRTRTQTYPKMTLVDGGGANEIEINISLLYVCSRRFMMERWTHVNQSLHKSTSFKRGLSFRENDLGGTWLNRDTCWEGIIMWWNFGKGK